MAELPPAVAEELVAMRRQIEDLNRTIAQQTQIIADLTAKLPANGATNQRTDAVMEIDNQASEILNNIINPTPSSSDGFTLVSRGKKRNSAPLPTASQSTPANPWSPLESLPDSNSDSDTDFPVLTQVSKAPRRYSPNASQAAPASAPSVPQSPPRSQSPPCSGASTAAPEAAKSKIPPVILRDPSKWVSIASSLSNRNIRFHKARQCSDGIRIQVSDVDSFRRLTKFFTDNRVEFHSFTLKEEKTRRAVLRPIPTQISTDEIFSDLSEKGFHPVKVSRLVRDRTKTAMPLVLVELPPNEDPMTISAVCNLCVSAEKPRKSGRPSQCHRCQRFHHAQRNCNAEHRCVKCAGSHATKDCKKQRDDAAKCVNCGGAHTANYRGCPSFPRTNRAPANRQAKGQGKPSQTPRATPSATPKPAPKPAPKPDPKPASPPRDLSVYAELISGIANSANLQVATSRVIAYLQNRGL